VVLVDPIMSNSTDQHWHHQGITLNLIHVFFFEEIKGVVIGLFHQCDHLVLGQVVRSFHTWLFHPNTHIEQLHGSIRIIHQFLLGSFEALWSDAEFIED